VPGDSFGFGIGSILTFVRKRYKQLKDKYNKQILGADEYWQNKSDCRYGVLVWLGEVKRIKPVRIEKRDWRAWVVLSNKENFGLLRSV
jgi:hypothetical protein